MIVLDSIEEGCSGACCAAFELPYTLGEYQRGLDPASKDPIADAEQIADMVIPIGPTLANARAGAVTGLHHQFKWSGRVRLFACRHWDERTRLCGIYSERPGMCRSYPDGGRCQHDDRCRCVGEAPGAAGG